MADQCSSQCSSQNPTLWSFLAQKVMQFPLMYRSGENMRTRTRFLLPALLAAAILTSGCASTSGTAALTNKDSLQSIEIHKTTKKDISRMFGAPSGQSKSTDYEIWSYSYTSVNMMPFFSNADIRQLNVTFNKQGVVTDYSTNKNGF
jgi:outer membrane protein assembly factor BamE (lipoprotein component of BamABCDE complex)